MLTNAIDSSLVCNELGEGPGELCQVSAHQGLGIGDGCRGQCIPQPLLKVAQLGKGPSQFAQILRAAPHQSLQRLFLLWAMWQQWTKQGACALKSQLKYMDRQQCYDHTNIEMNIPNSEKVIFMMMTTMISMLIRKHISPHDIFKCMKGQFTGT